MKENRVGVKWEYLYWYRFGDGDCKWTFGQRYFLSMLDALEFVLDRYFRRGTDKVEEDDHWYWRVEAPHRHGWGNVSIVIVRRKDMPDPDDFNKLIPPPSPKEPVNPKFKPLPCLKL